MKKHIVLILAGLVVAGTAFAQYPGQQVTVGTTNVMLLPPAKPTTTNQWKAATAYVRGDQIVAASGTPYYWCVTAGTSTNAIPTFGTTNDVTDGPSCVWRMVNPERRAFTVQYHGSAILHLGFGFPATSGKGVGLYGGSAWQEGFGGGKQAYQGAVYGITSSGSANVSIQEQ